MPFLQSKGKTAAETYHYTVPHHIVDQGDHADCDWRGDLSRLLQIPPGEAL